MRENPMRLHPAQQDIYTDQLIDPGSSQYNIGGYLKLMGPLDVQKLHQAVASAPSVFDAFKIRFDVQEPEPVCYFDEACAEYPMGDMDFSTHSHPAEAALAWMQQRFNTAFVLEQNNPLFEQYLLKINSNEHWFLGKYHHLMADGYGFVVWIQYMARKYQSLVAGDGQLFHYPQYREEMLKYNDPAAMADYEADAAYWKEKIPAKPERWLQKRQHRSSADRKSITYILNLTEAQRADLQHLQLATKAGLQSLTIAALLIYLGKTTGQSEFVFGIPVHKRNSKRLRSIVGSFTGVLPFKGRYDAAQTVDDFLKEIAASQRSDYRHQSYLVGDVSRHLKIGSAEGYLSDVIINYEPLNFDLDFGPAIHTTIARLTNEDERNPLKIVWRDYNTEQPLQLHIHFSNEYFSLPEIELLAQRLLHILSQFALLESRTGSISILPPAETALLKSFNNTAAYTQGKTIIDLFTAQVLAVPHSDAVVFGREKLSYHQLNQRANQLAQFLLEKGVQPEALVAVCIERSVEMMVAIIGVLKAGAAYLPIDPNYPAERMAYMLADSAAAILISSRQSRPKLPHAAQVQVIEMDSQWPEISRHTDDGQPIAIAPRQLAYVIYTSGSTGRPKGVMIEHSGVVNLALSQAEFLGLKPGTKTLQFASCGFDASCYEIFNTLLSGGCLVLCTKQDLLSAESFEQVINEQAVELAVLPPSYLLVAAGHLGTLRTIVSAGEPLNEAVARQVQATGVRLINAYGPTETTVCASLTDEPVQKQHTIVIGRPVANVPVYILDAQNSLTPLGTTGEIGVAGIQVARGYLNRPELTNEKFIANPFDTDGGEKLYKTGDLGRWLPNGNLVYLGRKDDQVKIRGYRIEPGEIEAVLQQHEAVQQAAVLAREDGEGNKRLVAYVVAKNAFDKAALIAFLQEKLPDYMVPALWVPLAEMPVTANGKTDRKALPDPDVTATLNTGFAAPQNEFETQLAGLWQDLLDVDKVGINDNFFELGGDSIITIQLVSKARQLGYELQVSDVFTYPTIAGLSGAMAQRQAALSTGHQEMLTGECGLLPIQQWYLQKSNEDISHYNQSVIIEIDKAVTAQVLQTAIESLVAYHDALRFRYQQTEGGWQQEYGHAKGSIITEDIRSHQNHSAAVLINNIEAAYQTKIDITTGELVKAVWIQTPATELNNRLLIIIHHLATDGVSWRILLEDMEQLIDDISSGNQAVLPLKTSSYRQWVDAITTYSNSKRLLAQTADWKQIANSFSPIPTDAIWSDVIRVKDTAKHTVQLTQAQTRSLLQEVPKKYRTGINDLLIAALAKTICQWSGTDKLIIGLEGHGREGIAPGVDTSRTVGWFTTLFPVLLQAEGKKETDDWIKSVKEQLRQVPDKGLGYGVLKYLNRDAALQGKDPWDIVFNYLGQLDNVAKQGKWLKAATQSAGDAVSGEQITDEKLSINCLVQQGSLSIHLTYSSRHFSPETIATIGQNYLSDLDAIITQHSQTEESIVVNTPSDFGLAPAISYPELDAFLAVKTNGIRRRESIQTLYALSGLQRGVLFHGLYDRGVAGTYISQFGCDLQNVDVRKFTESWELVMARHNVLRTAFYYDEFKVPVQCVYRHAQLPLAVLDYRSKNESERTIALKEFEKADRLQGFDFKTAPLMRFALIQITDDAYRMLWTWHHILLDGWSLPVLIQEFLTNYDALLKGEKITVQEEDSYEKFIRYIDNQDKDAAAEYWQQYLQPLTERTQLPFVEIKPDEDERTGQNKLIFLTINKAESAGIKSFAQRNQVTINTVMQGVLALLIHQYTGKKDIAYGVTVSGRPDALDDVETGVGMYINTLPLYSQVQGDEEITTWLQQLQATQLASRQYQHTPLFDIQANGTVSGDLFDTLLVFENYPVSKLLSEKEWSLQISNYRVHDQSNFPLTIAVNDAAEIFIQFSYNSGIIQDAYIDKLRSHFHQVLLQLTGNEKHRLNEIKLLTPDDEQLLIEFNNTTTAYPAERTIVDLFEAQVAATPDATALLFEEEQLTYQQLNERANQLARYLTLKGVRKGSPVPVCMERGTQLIVALLGILKAGGVYVPIDPEYPQPRIDYMLQDTGATVVIAGTFGKEKLTDTDIEIIDLNEDEAMIGYYPVTNLGTAIHPDDLAYIIYTSGSTGTPKGVMVPHRGNVNMSLDQVRQFNITAQDRVLQFASVSFDASISEIFMAFYAGASLVLMPKEKIQDGTNFPAHLEAAGVSVVTLPPVYLRALQQDELTFLRVIITAGEAADVATAAYLSNYVDYYNAYGPTECAVCVSIYKVAPQDAGRTRIPIGKPIANTRVFILNEQLQLAPIGVPGEIYVAGAGLAKGYLNLPERTAEKFIASPFEAVTILYKTGDTGKWLPDGNIEFLGRQDDQIKLRGYRIELGEIETTLSQHKAVERSVALVKEVKDDKQLIVYYQPKEKIKLWPSVAEFYVYDDLLYKTMAGDDARNARYRNAIRKVVKNKVVLEIGPGFEAILSRICIEEGAAKVYAVELLEDSYLKAKKTVEDLGLTDQIIVIHDDITRVQLPELADLCVSEIVGAIGGAEGSATLINSSRRLLKDPSCMIPARSLTKIAAITLPEDDFDPGFEELGAYYTSKIFEQAGHRFDLRVYLSSFPTRYIISDDAAFEDLDYTNHILLEDEHSIHLTITQNAVLHGFIVWLNLYCDGEELIDTLHGKYTWLPVYLPAFYNGEPVAAGDAIHAKITRRLSSNQLNPDFYISGTLVRQGEAPLLFTYESLYCSSIYQGNEFYSKIFENDTIRLASKVNKDELREFLKSRLPEYMVPSLLMEVEQFPLTISGKIDRKALPDADAQELLAGQYLAPQSQIENALADIWKEVLEIDQVGIHDNFFELGGHSLLAIRLIAVIRDQLNIEVAIATIFDHPTIEALARQLEAGSTADVTAIQLQARPQHIPLSFGQERLWFIHQLEGSVEYHSPAALRLTGRLDVKALEQSLAAITDRHEVLRTVFVETGGLPYQFIKEGGNWHLAVTDSSQYAGDADALRRGIEQLVRQPFDLAKDYMLRATLIRLSAEDHVLVVVMHHIAADAWSMPIIVNELAECYRSFTTGTPAHLPALPLQYADYAIWQRDYLTPDVLAEKLAYWKRKLNGVLPLQLPTDVERPAVRTTNGGNLPIAIDTALLDKLHQLSQQQGATLFMTLLAVFKVLLYRYTGQQDISVGTSIANRTRQESEGLIGFFVNTLAFRDEVTGNALFTELLQQVRTTTLDAYAHQEVPFEKVVEAVVKERDAANSPLFQVMLVLQNTPEVPEITLGPLTIAPEPYDFTNVKFDLTFFLAETPQGLQGTVVYSTDLFSRSRMERMIAHFTTLLQSVVATPANAVGSLPMLTEAEQSSTQPALNRVAHVADNTVVALFEKQALRWPTSVAVVFEETEITYGELNAGANRLAHHLRQCGVQEDTLVPLFIDRGPDMITGILGILKAGGAYVPIDTGLPQERIGYMLQDTAAKVVVCNEHSRDKLSFFDDIRLIEIDGTTISSQPADNLNRSLTTENLAYVIYTSGSTGQPKGVMITHGNLADYVQGLDDRTGINACNSFALVSNIATDLGNTVLYSSLISGGTLHLFSRESVSNIEYLHDYFKEQDIDCVKIVPSHWKALVMDGKPLLPRRLLVFGGESLQAEQVALIKQYRRKCRVVNHYGPTETTVGKLLYEVDFTTEYSGTIPIGTPFCDSRIYVLSADRQLCPAGVPGQLYIGGAGVAKGYLNNQQLTQQKFIPDPFDAAADTLLYATGDLVKYDADGNVIFLGRIDDQVKIRGYRVEPGEVERVILASGLVETAVVLAREDKQDTKRLIAYIVAPDFDREALLAHLTEKLPDYMIPSAIVEIKSLPLTPNGKIDRKALPDPEAQAGGEADALPQTAAEQQMAAIWQEVLEEENIGIHADFFALGGHSLLAIRLISAIRKSFGQEVSIGAIFDHPTIAGLLAHMQVPDDSGEEELLPAITTVHPRPAHVPLSFSQERLWFIDRLEGSIQYHVPAVLRLKGRLNVGGLSRAFREIIWRHEVLRTVIRSEDGTPFQYLQEADSWEIEQIEAGLYQWDEAALQQQVAELIHKPFNLATDYMLRAHLLPVAAAEHILVVTLHHIASDGWSRSVLVKELVELYRSFENNSSANLKPLPVQYADYSLWQRSYLQGEILEKKLAYWKSKLQGVASLELPTDYVRPAILSTQGHTSSFAISKPLADRLEQLSRKQGATLFMTLLATFKVLLHRYTGQPDICVGTPVAGRQQQNLEGLIGFFVNTLAIRSQLMPEVSFIELLEQVRATTLQAFEHQEVPFEKLVDAVVQERDLSRNPLFQVMFVLRNTPDVPELSLGQVQLTVETHRHTTAMFDLQVFLTETPEGIEGVLEYSTDLYKQVTIKRMLGHYLTLLEAVTQQPGQRIGYLPLLAQTEQHQLIVAFNNTPADYPTDKTIIDLFEAQVLQTPHATAVWCEENQLTYKELNERVNQLAHYLRSKGVTAETLVPVCMERSLEMIVSILGILKAGGAYVPIDPTYPVERIQYMLDDTAATIILGTVQSRVKLPQTASFDMIFLDEALPAIRQQPTGNLPKNSASNNLAYVIYTSGSTGQPKGVMNQHSGLLNRLLWAQDYFRLTEADSVLQKTSFSFDVSVWELVWPLITGARLVFARPGGHRDNTYLKNIIAQQKITLLHFVPSMLSQFLSDVWSGECTGLKKVLCSGEALSAAQVTMCSEKLPATELHNLYGPTEAAIDVTCWTVPQGFVGKEVPIGKPVSNTCIYILDPFNQPLPLGVAGEIVIGGVQVARGYLNKAALTAEKFVADPFSTVPGATMYRTGDLGKWLPDGNIAHLGRIDTQVKVRGFRIELGEVETAMNELNYVNTSCVVAKQEIESSNRLVSYYVPDMQAIKAKEAALYQQQVNSWQEVYENEYRQEESDNDLDTEFNTVSWVDSFTGLAIPKAQMEEWVADIVQVILSENTGHVVEIGCGTGLIYFRLAGKVKKYTGSDISATSIGQIRRYISNGQKEYGPTELQVGAAHEMIVANGEKADTIILNSVVQYFPGEAYMNDVIRNSITNLKGSGRIIIGDVRDKRLLHLFKSRLQLRKLQGSVSMKELAWSVEQELLKEEELCFSPEYFYALPSRHPQIKQVEIQWKQGQYENEMTLYRYNVVIHVGIKKAITTPDWQNWNPADMPGILYQIQQAQPVIAIKDAPNQRLWKEQQLSRLLDTTAFSNVNHLSEALNTMDEESRQVAVLLEAAHLKGYSYRMLLDKNPLLVNILIELQPSANFISNIYNDAAVKADGSFTNIPLFSNIVSLLTKEIRTALGQKLPEYMVPSECIAISNMPLTANGKADRLFLSRREDRSTTNKFIYQPPRTELESQLCVIWQELLGIERIGIQDSFFELGGHSLLGMRLISAMRKKLNVEVAIKDLFVNPTIALLATHLHTPPARQLLPSIKAVQRPELVPLSFSQERLWFIDKLSGSVPYHLPFIIRLRGRVAVPALQHTLQTIVQRHEVLRSIIRENDGQGYQYVQDAAGWQLSITNAFINHNEPAELRLHIQQGIDKPFDLATDYLLRAQLIALSEEEHLLVVTVHHIASDGWSSSIITQEVAALYSAFIQQLPVPLAPLPIQYTDYAIWQRSYLQGQVLDDKLGYWKNKLAGVAPLQLPAAAARPPVWSGRGAVVPFTFNQQLSAAVKAFSRQQDCTLFMTLLAAFNVLLHRYSSQADICVGTSVANRNQQETEGLIGFFVNMLALRNQVAGNVSFTNLLQQVKTTTLEAYEQGDVPFEKVVDAVVTERDMSKNPLIQVMLILLNTPPAPELQLGDLLLSIEEPEGAKTLFDISFYLSETADELNGWVVYATDLYSHRTISRMIGHFTELLTQLIAQPQQPTGTAPMLMSDERQRLLIDFNDTTATYPTDKTIVTLFEEQAARTPDAIAVVYEAEQLTYWQLNEQANRLACLLQSKGVTAETLVPICMERSPDMIVGILGILKAGGAYVPVDPTYPAERIRFMLEDTGATLVVSSRQSSLLLPALPTVSIITLNAPELLQQPAANLPTGPQAHHLAYVIYTSGSTGRPKGVLIEHRNVVRLFKTSRPLFDFSEQDVWSLFHSFSFDFSVWEMYGALLYGGRLIIVPAEVTRDAAQFAALISREGITILNQTPAAFYNLQSQLSETAVPLSVRQVIFGGEALNPSKLQWWSNQYPACRLTNMYGITETTVHVTHQEITPDQINSTDSVIGKPIPTLSIYIVDDFLNPVPEGVPGEIYVAGEGLARGYLHLPELTAERFIPDPFSQRANARMYKTGDLGRWLPNGTIVYMGRRDEQVKIRGYRIELGEIETAIQQSGLVQQAVVMVSENEAGTKRLVGYVVTDQLNREALVASLRAKLPEYMVPALWVQLDALPLTANGKTDIKALPAPVAEPLSSTYAAPRNKLETDLATVWQEVLHIDQVGIEDNFFELGGDSIITIQVVSRLKRLGHSIQPKDIFIHQSIRKLSTAILSEAGAQAEQETLTGEAGLLPIQQWYLGKNQPDVSHFNQSILLSISKQLPEAVVSKAIQHIVEHHDALRFTYSHGNGVWQQQYGNRQVELIIEDLQLTALPAETITQAANQYQQNLDIEQGRIVNAVLLLTPAANTYNRLLMVVHHLAIDGVSWRILLEDLEQLLGQLSTGSPADTGKKSSSYRQWFQTLEAYSLSRKLLAQTRYWNKAVSSYQPLPVDKNATLVRVQDLTLLTLQLSAPQTRLLLQSVPRAYHTEINDILLSCLGWTLCHWCGSEQVVVGLEGHGREPVGDAPADVSRTVGWFTSLYPVVLQAGANSHEPGDWIKAVKEQLRQVPDKGIGYGVLKYITREPSLQGNDPWDLVFNYLGQLDNVIRNSEWLAPAGETAGTGISPQQLVSEKLSVNCHIQEGQLVLNWRYSRLQYHDETIRVLAQNYLSHLVQIINHCVAFGSAEAVYTPADYGLSAEVSYQELDRFLEENSNDNIMSF